MPSQGTRKARKPGKPGNQESQESQETIEARKARDNMKTRTGIDSSRARGRGFGDSGRQWEMPRMGISATMGVNAHDGDFGQKETVLAKLAKQRESSGRAVERSGEQWESSGEQWI